jgi:SSS family solute:Na+ symporter
VSRVGGLDALPERLEALCAGGGCVKGLSADEILAFTPSRARDPGLAFLAVIALQWLVQINADGTGYLAQRSMACRSDRDARTAAVVFTVAQVVFRSLLWLPIALGLLVLFPPDAAVAPQLTVAAREATFVIGIQRLLPVGLLGLMLTAMLAALASTVDTHLNWGASYVTNDLYRRFYCAWRGKTPAARTLVWVARGSNAVILALSLVIMTQLSSIQVAWQASLLLGAGMGVLLVLRWLWWRITAWGEVAAVGVSLLLAPILIAVFPTQREALLLLVMALVATTAGVTASLLSGRENLEQLRRFYARARPPGLWGPVCAAVGDPPEEAARRLRRGLLATILASVSIFAVLTGAGSWLVGSPPPAWFASRPVWIALLVTVGVGLAPVWWRLGFGRGNRA